MCGVWPWHCAALQSFLQGLLMKDPHQRLSWPELLSHPFVAGRVTGEYQIISPSYCLETGSTSLPFFIFFYPGLCLLSHSLHQPPTPSSCPWGCFGFLGILLGLQSWLLSLCLEKELLKFCSCLLSD